MQVLEEARELVSKRLAELDDERSQLERALSELGGSAAPSQPKPRRQTRKKRSGRGTVLTSALGVVAAHPEGIGGQAIADELKMKPNYLYRILKEAASAGQIKKKGRLYFAT